MLEVTGSGAITFFTHSLHSRLTHSPVVCLLVHRVGLLTLRATASLPATWQSSRLALGSNMCSPTPHSARCPRDPLWRACPHSRCGTR